jgi:hypothetical protein
VKYFDYIYWENEKMFAIFRDKTWKTKCFHTKSLKVWRYYPTLPPKVTTYLRLWLLNFWWTMVRRWHLVNFKLSFSPTKDLKTGVFSILQPHLCLWDILLWDILLWDILLRLYTSTKRIYKPLTISFKNILNKKYVNKYF